MAEKNSTSNFDAMFSDRSSSASDDGSERRDGFGRRGGRRHVGYFSYRSRGNVFSGYGRRPPSAEHEDEYGLSRTGHLDRGGKGGQGLGGEARLERGRGRNYAFYSQSRPKTPDSEPRESSFVWENSVAEQDNAHRKFGRGRERKFSKPVVEGAGLEGIIARGRSSSRGRGRIGGGWRSRSEDGNESCSKFRKGVGLEAVHGPRRGLGHTTGGRGKSHDDRRYWRKGGDGFPESVAFAPKRGRGGFRGEGRRGRGARGSKETRFNAPPTPRVQYRDQEYRGWGNTDHKKYSHRRGVVPTGVMFTESEFVRLSSLDSMALVQEVDENLKDFQAALERLLLKSPSVVNAMIRILSKLTKVASGAESSCSSDHQESASRIVAELLSERSDNFHFRLKQAVNKATSGSVLNEFCELFQELLNTFQSSAWSCLPIDELGETAERVSESNLKLAREIVELRDNIRDKLLHKSTNAKKELSESDEGRDNSQYRTIPIFPTWPEISIDNGTPDSVRPNRVQERYRNWMEYYDIQFRLVREDFIAPLRKGIHAYLQGKRGRNLRDVKSYSGVTIEKPVATLKSICFEIKFNVSRLGRINWDHSKRLIFGSLLCFFPSNEGTDVLFASVTDRNEKLLENGRFMVQFEDIVTAVTHCHKRTRFEVAESTAFFEATRPILHSLKEAEVNTMPFTKQLIKGDCSSVPLPVYLREKETAKYDLSCLYGPKRSRRLPLHVDILNEESWSAASDTELDESQLKAIRAALTQEMTVIQGPPGTGKTFIGLKIVQALLENCDTWNPSRYYGKSNPILVMCYTNHALDQFLEEIMKSELDYERCPKVVRVGSRTKNEAVEKISIGKLRYLQSFPEIGSLKADLKSFEVDKMWRKVAMFFRKSQMSILPMNIIQHVADPYHYSQLYQVAFNEKFNNESKESVMIWLQLMEKVPCNSKDQKEASNSAKGIASRVTPKDSEVSTFPPSLPVAKINKQLIRVEGEADQNEQLIEVEGEAVLAQQMRMTIDDIEDFKAINFHSEEDSDMSDSERKWKDEPNKKLNDEQQYSSDSETGSESENSSESSLNKGDSSLKKAKRVKNSEQKRKVKLKWKEKDNMTQLIDKNMFKFYMDEEEANEVEDIHHLSINDRWRLYNYWVKKRHEYLLTTNLEDFHKYNEIAEELSEARDEEDKTIMETADVIGMTTTCAAKYQKILHRIKPKIIIVEEAAEVLEAHIVSALSAGTQHLILIGDHKQLRPKPNDYTLERKYNFSVSLFERMVIKNLSRVTLKIQHRMHPEIAKLVHPHVYDTLENHESVSQYPPVTGVTKPLFFITHTHPESEDPNLLSATNDHEAEYITKLCAHFLNLGYSPNQITILTPYVGQMLKLRGKMPKSKFEGVRIAAIDNFQGEENDIILFSMVRSSSSATSNESSKHSTIGFLKEDNRVCVSLSRAKHGFYAVGNFHFIRKHSLLWESIISDVETRGCIGEGLPLFCQNHPTDKYVAEKPSDFEAKAPSGGCLLDCNTRLSCGHVCPQKCHVNDCEHKNYKCRKLCARIDENEHKCKPKHDCFSDCPPCKEIVTKTMLECGHKQEIECWIDLSEAKCNTILIKSCDKGLHTMQKKCHQSWGVCRKGVSETIPNCKHTQEVPCYQDPSDFSCRAPCEKSCDMGHPCQKLCHEQCGRCLYKVEKELRCGHKHQVQCFSRSRMIYNIHCSSPCSKECKNGHICGRPCHYPYQCSSCTVLAEKIMPDCGHSQMVPCHDLANKVECKGKVEVDAPCGHKIVTECWKKNLDDMLKRECRSNCFKQLECGHYCKKKCNEKCECFHPIVKKLSCGHKSTYECHQVHGSEEPPCNHKCPKRLACGHKCKNKCGQLCSVCLQMSIRKYPCGHSNKIVCSDPIKYNPCKQTCHVKLICGHQCSGNCGDCYRLRMHAPCQLNVKVLHYSGSFDTIPCKGLVDERLSRRPLKVFCSPTHNPILFNKSEDLISCIRPCSWNCPHFTCTKKCGEKCDRPPCNKPCPNLLYCGHPCRGLCGEPCIICPECEPHNFEMKFRSGKRKKKARLVRGGRYYVLRCGHIFTVDYLDKCLLSVPNSVEVVTPKQCPVCQECIQTSFRYGNAAKTSLEDVSIVNGELKRYLTTHYKIELQDALQIEAGFKSWVKTTYSANFKTSTLYILPRGWNRLLYQLSYGDYMYKDWEENLISSEEEYLIRCLIILHNLSKKLKDFIYTRIHMDIREQLEHMTYYFFEASLRGSPTLSWQLLEDFRSEAFRITLLANCALAKYPEYPKPHLFSAYSKPSLVSSVCSKLSDSPVAKVSESSTFFEPSFRHFSHSSEEKDALLVSVCSKLSDSSVTKASESSKVSDSSEEEDALVKVDQYIQSLNPLHDRITEEEFRKQLSHLKQSYPSLSLINITAPPLPPVVKGTWMKCQNGHYYCIPPNIAVRKINVENEKCPQCL